MNVKAIIINNGLEIKTILECTSDMESSFASFDCTLDTCTNTLTTKRTDQ